jgi:hypothetical protein
VAVDGESFTSTLPYRVPVAVQLRRLLGILWIHALFKYRSLHGTSTCNGYRHCTSNTNVHELQEVPEYEPLVIKLCRIYGDMSQSSGTPSSAVVLTSHYFSNFEHTCNMKSFERVRDGRLIPWRGEVNGKIKKKG